MKKLLSLVLVLLLIATVATAKKKKDKGDDEEADQGPMSAKTFAGLKLRGIGPAINSGRVTDFAVTPGKHQRFFIATASGARCSSNLVSP